MERIKNFECLKKVIGNTPLYKIKYRYKGKEDHIYAKAEQFNFTGSIKDRLALYVLGCAIKRGELCDGMHIAEATSGNTGISFSALGSALGIPVTIFMPNWMSMERIQLIKSFCANIVLVSKEEGGFLGSIGKTKKLAECEGNVYLPCQFDNEDNILAHYDSTAPEIEAQLATLGEKIDCVVAGVGTGGTIMGLAKYFKEKDENILCCPLEPASSPTLKTGHKVGAHRIQGISDEFIPSIVDLDFLDGIVDVDDGDAILAAQMLSKIGVGVGISSGANLLGAIEMKEKLGEGKNVVTIFSDDSKKYLSTDLMKDEPIKEGFMSPDLEIIGLDVIHPLNEK